MQTAQLTVASDAPALPILTASQEAFARHYATFGDPKGAAVHAFDVNTTRPASIQQMAYRALRHPGIARRITALRNALADGDGSMSARRLIADMEALASADPNELMTITVVNCRFCWGAGHRYQWRDDRELADATSKALTSHGAEPIPDAAGGTGFRGDREPNAECTRCDGHGLTVTRFADLSDVSPAARMLVKTIEMHSDGSIKRLVLHDQMAIRTELHRLRGLHVDRSVSLNVNANVAPLGQMSREDALAFLERIAPSAAHAAAPPIDAEFTETAP